MKTKAATFPKELNLRFFRDTDKEFIWITSICYLISIIGCLIMMNVKLPGITDSEVEQMLERYTLREVIIADDQAQQKIEYRTKNTDNRLLQAADDLNANMALTKEQSDFQHQKQTTSVQVGKQLSALLTASVFKAVGGRTGGGVFSNQLGGGETVFQGGTETLGQPGNGITGMKTISPGVNLNQSSNLVVSEHDAALVAKLQAAGERTDLRKGLGNSKLTLAELRDLPLDVIIERAKVTTNNSIKVTPANPSNTLNTRNRNEVNSSVNSHSNEIRACFQQYLRRDPNLTGNVTLSFTILADGTIGIVKVVEDNWTDSEFGKLVEQSICERIKNWHFLKIKVAEPTLCTLSYVFSR